MASALDREIPGDPVWMYAIATSGATKTEILRSLSLYDRVYSADTITRPALISGFGIVNEKTGKYEIAGGILKDLDGKVLVIKDGTSVLTLPQCVRDELFGCLRGIYDGYYRARGWSLFILPLEPAVFKLFLYPCD